MVLTVASWWIEIGKEGQASEYYRSLTFKQDEPPEENLRLLDLETGRFS